MEIGSFIELQYPKGKEYYGGETDIARLNSGRVAIWHAHRVLECEAIWLPYYQCESVREFLLRKQVPIKYYHIDSAFEPIDLEPSERESVLLVNYYGIMPQKKMEAVASAYQNVIIDHAQAFFAKPLQGCMNVYSTRKFMGVADGAYVIGKGAGNYLEEYPQGYSSDTAQFLLQRVEYGCEGKTYESRMKNEERIDREDARRMSPLTRYILDGTDYAFIQEKRKENFTYAATLFRDVNALELQGYATEDCVPMIYPLVIEDDTLLERLLQAKHFQGHWWNYILTEGIGNTFESWLSRYMIPITIDQRYGREELEFLKRMIG